MCAIETYCRGECLGLIGPKKPANNVITSFCFVHETYLFWHVGRNSKRLSLPIQRRNGGTADNEDKTCL